MSCWSKRLNQVWSLTTCAEIASALTQTTLNKYQSKQILCAVYLQSFKRRIKRIVNTVMSYLATIFIFTQNAIQETAKSVQISSRKCVGMGCSILDFANVGTPRMQKANVSLAICAITENKRGKDYVAS
jgi:tRNA(His) 5'-end guanylyltransferase